MNLFNKIRENLKDPKKNALTKLGLYGIFFIIVFIVFASSNTNTPTYIPEENNNVVSSYSYIYKINNNEVIKEVTGTLKDNKDTFNYNGLNYTKEDGIVYFNNTATNIDFDIDKYKYEKIELLIENSDSKTTYNDSNKVVYNMCVSEYFTLLNEANNCNIMDCSLIQAQIFVETDIYINKVLIDLSNYYGYKYIIEISYDNINNIN